MTLAVSGKLPSLAPGEFRFTTKALVPEQSEDGRRRFRTIASSTVVDMKGDEMKLSALEDMRDAFRRGVLIFMNHKYDAPDSGFGMSDEAEIRESGDHDPRTGTPIYDLHVAGFVDESNPKAVQLNDSMLGGMRWGTSVGAIVKAHKRNKAGALDIEHVDLKEGSIVGIPMNQRSWVQKAANAVANLEDAEAVGLLDDEDDESEPAAKIATPAVALGVPVTVTDGLTDGSLSTSVTWVVPSGTDDSASGGSETVKALDSTSGAALQSQSLCPSCGKARGVAGDCADSYHADTDNDLKGVETLPAETIDATNDETTAGGQEAEVATPENAPEAEGATPEPASDEEAHKGVFATEDVVELARHVQTLAGLIDERDAKIAALEGDLSTVTADRDRLASENAAASEVIEKVMREPLRPKTGEYIAGFSASYPDFLDPEVKRFLQKTAGDH